MVEHGLAMVPKYLHDIDSRGNTVLTEDTSARRRRSRPRACSFRK